MADVRVTINFKPLFEMGYSENDAGRLLNQYKQDSPQKIEYDKRNGIWCLSPTYDLHCYLNYIKYLNLHYSEWKAYGYLDLGLVPILICPSFMADEMNEQVGTLAKSWTCPVYSMKSTSFLQSGYNGMTNDVWVRREDLAQMLGVPLKQATTSKFLEAALNLMGEAV